MKWQAEAPTNIALIKYMGKKDATSNIPLNASLSYTLDNLRSFVELEQTINSADSWEPLQDPRATFIPELNTIEQQRFLRHLALLKKQFNYTGNFIVRSANNFPAGCGLASSAASFAALTLCAVQALTALSHAEPMDRTAMAELSRQGSGSSCRSFFSPWVLWRDAKVAKVNLPYQDLLHHVAVVSHQKKLVNSSEAHRRVQTSALFNGRVERAEQRLIELSHSLAHQEWRAAYLTVWQEFWDMHALFQTAKQPFGYLQPASLTVLDYLSEYWENNGDGPLITLDAGPNVHMLFRADQAAMANEIKNTLAKNFEVI